MTAQLDRLLISIVVLLIAWNLLGNLLLPGPFYVPANLAVGAGAIALGRHFGLTWNDLGLARDHVGRGLAVGLATGAVVVAVLLVASQVTAFESFFENDDVRNASGFDRWFFPLVRIPLGTAVTEEILFRSVLLGALLLRLERAPAVLVSALAFALWHIVPSWENATGSGVRIVGTIVGIVVFTGAAGIAFAVIRLWAGSVIAPIITHALTNSTAYVAALIALDVV